MSLEDLSRLANIVGVVLVIASLVYLARQLKQTVEMLRINPSHERLQRDTELSTAFSEPFQKFLDENLAGSTL